MSVQARTMGRGGKGYWVREALKAPTPLALYVLTLVFLLVTLAVSNAFVLNIVFDLMFWITLAISMNIIMGYTGYVSFGHVMFMGVAGYVIAYIMEYWFHGFAVQHPVAAAAIGTAAGAAAAAALAAVVGAVTLRLRGAFFAIATIAVDLALYYAAQLLNTEAGSGEVYFSVVPTMTEVTLLAWIVFALSVVVSIIIKKSRLGAGLEAIREDEDAAEALGVPTALYKTVAFVISAAIAGAMGAIYAWKTANVTPSDAFNLAYSIRMIVADVIGGMGYLLGPVVGGAVYYLIYTALTVTSPALGQVADIVLGALAIVIVLFAPRGIIGYLREWLLYRVGPEASRVLE